MDATELAVIGEINQRLGRIEAQQTEQGKLVAEIATNSASIPARVSDLEAWRSEQKGERRAFAVVGGVIGSAVTGGTMAVWHLMSGH